MKEYFVYASFSDPSDSYAAETATEAYELSGFSPAQERRVFGVWIVKAAKDAGEARLPSVYLNPERAYQVL